MDQVPEPGTTLRMAYVHGSWTAHSDSAAVAAARSAAERAAAAAAAAEQAVLRAEMRYREAQFRAPSTVPRSVSCSPGNAERAAVEPSVLSALRGAGPGQAVVEHLEREGRLKRTRRKGVPRSRSLEEGTGPLVSELHVLKPLEEETQEPGGPETAAGSRGARATMDAARVAAVSAATYASATYCLSLPGAVGRAGAEPVWRAPVSRHVSYTAGSQPLDANSSPQSFGWPLRNPLVSDRTGLETGEEEETEFSFPGPWEGATRGGPPQARPVQVTPQSSVTLTLGSRLENLVVPGYVEVPWAKTAHREIGGVHEGSGDAAAGTPEKGQKRPMEPRFDPLGSAGEMGQGKGKRQAPVSTSTHGGSKSPSARKEAETKRQSVKVATEAWVMASELQTTQEGRGPIKRKQNSDSNGNGRNMSREEPMPLGRSKEKQALVPRSKTSAEVSESVLNWLHYGDPGYSGEKKLAASFISGVEDDAAHIPEGTPAASLSIASKIPTEAGWKEDCSTLSGSAPHPLPVWNIEATQNYYSRPATATAVSGAGGARKRSTRHGSAAVERGPGPLAASSRQGLVPRSRTYTAHGGEWGVPHQDARLVPLLEGMRAYDSNAEGGREGPPVVEQQSWEGKGRDGLTRGNRVIGDSKASGWGVRGIIDLVSLRPVPKTGNGGDRTVFLDGNVGRGKKVGRIPVSHTFVDDCQMGLKSQEGVPALPMVRPKTARCSTVPRSKTSTESYGKVGQETFMHMLQEEVHMAGQGIVDEQEGSMGPVAVRMSEERKDWRIVRFRRVRPRTAIPQTKTIAEGEQGAMLAAGFKVEELSPSTPAAGYWTRDGKATETYDEPRPKEPPSALPASTPAVESRVRPGTGSKEVRWRSKRRVGELVPRSVTSVPGEASVESRGGLNRNGNQRHLEEASAAMVTASDHEQQVQKRPFETGEEKQQGDPMAVPQPQSAVGLRKEEEKATISGVAKEPRHRWIWGGRPSTAGVPSGAGRLAKQGTEQSRNPASRGGTDVSLAAHCSERNKGKESLDRKEEEAMNGRPKTGPARKSKGRLRAGGSETEAELTSAVSGLEGVGGAEMKRPATSAGGARTRSRWFGRGSSHAAKAATQKQQPSSVAPALRRGASDGKGVLLSESGTDREDTGRHPGRSRSQKSVPGEDEARTGRALRWWRVRPPAVQDPRVATVKEARAEVVFEYDLGDGNLVEESAPASIKVPSAMAGVPGLDSELEGSSGSGRSQEGIAGHFKTIVEGGVLENGEDVLSSTAGATDFLQGARASTDASSSLPWLTEDDREGERAEEKEVAEEVQESLGLGSAGGRALEWAEGETENEAGNGGLWLEESLASSDLEEESEILFAEQVEGRGGKKREGKRPVLDARASMAKTVTNTDLKETRTSKGLLGRLGLRAKRGQTQSPGGERELVGSIESGPRGLPSVVIDAHRKTDGSKSEHEIQLLQLPSTAAQPKDLSKTWGQTGGAAVGLGRPSTTAGRMGTTVGLFAGRTKANPISAGRVEGRKTQTNSKHGSVPARFLHHSVRKPGTADARHEALSEVETLGSSTEGCKEKGRIERAAPVGEPAAVPPSGVGGGLLIAQGQCSHQRSSQEVDIAAEASRGRVWMQRQGQGSSRRGLPISRSITDTEGSRHAEMAEGHPELDGRADCEECRVEAIIKAALLEAASEGEADGRQSHTQGSGSAPMPLITDDEADNDLRLVDRLRPTAGGWRRRRGAGGVPIQRTVTELSPGAPGMPHSHAIPQSISDTSVQEGETQGGSCAGVAAGAEGVSRSKTGPGRK